MQAGLPSILRKTFFVVLCGLVVPLPGMAAEPPETLAESLPPGAVAFAEASQLGSVFERIEGSEWMGHLKQSPQYEDAIRLPPNRKALAVVEILEAQLGMDLWSVSRTIFGHQVAVAVYRRQSSSDPDVVAVARIADRDAWRQIRARLEPFLVLAEDRLESTETASGAKIIAFKDHGALALHAQWIAAANTRDRLDETVALLESTGPMESDEENGPAGEGPATMAKTLADDETFQRMTADMGAKHLLRAYIDTEKLAEAAGGRFVPQKLDNPLASLLFGGIVELAAHSRYAGFTLDVDDRQVVLTAGLPAQTCDLGAAHQPFFSSPDGPGTPPLPELSRQIAAFGFYRDFAQWYRHREQLLQPQVLPGFDAFEAGLANLLPGKDFGTDVLPLLGRNFTLVAAIQDYDHLDGAPGLKLPGFGLVIELAQPQEAADLLQLFFQTLSSILNIQAGQQGRQPWVMMSESYAGVQISYGRYLEKPHGERLPIVFNFMPASARVGDRFVITSSVGLCRQLVDHLQQPPADAERSPRNLDFELRIDVVGDIFESNREFFEARAVQQGKPLERAQREFDAVLNLIRSWESLRLNSKVKPASFQVQLEGHWK